MRVLANNDYANLRLSTFSSYHAAFLATLPGVPDKLKTESMCLARSQMDYVAGDTGRSYIVGFGQNFPQRVHHRDSACTMKEDSEGLCDRCGAARARLLARLASCASERSAGCHQH
jgi:Glycosyl hydrolase family 9